MTEHCPVEAAVRERVAVAETLLQTVVRYHENRPRGRSASRICAFSAMAVRPRPLANSVEKFVVTVETLCDRVSQERGQRQVTSRLDSAVIAAGAGLAGALITMLINLLLHHAP